MGWLQYALAILLFDVIGVAVVYALRRLQLRLFAVARLGVQHGAHLRLLAIAGI